MSISGALLCRRFRPRARAEHCARADGEKADLAALAAQAIKAGTFLFGAGRPQRKTRLKLKQLA
jgi:hypothetical protein